MKMIKFFFLILLFSNLISCGPTINPPEAESLLNKPMKLDKPRYLTHTKYMTWMNTTRDFLVMEPPNRLLPTIKDYQIHSGLWRQWHVRRGAQYRIVGLLPAGTRFHFYEIIVPENPSTDLYEFHAMIDSGPFQNTSVYYSY